MTLDRALHILSRVHLREDDLAGFTVQMGARPDYWNLISQEEYIEAWEAVWLHTKIAQEPVAYLTVRGEEERVVLAKFVHEDERVNGSNGWTAIPLFITPNAESEMRTENAQ